MEAAGVKRYKSMPARKINRAPKSLLWITLAKSCPIK
jgi:hypothetical protein